MNKAARVSIAWASPKDLNWLIRHDPHIRKRILREKVQRCEVLIARRAGRIVGWLRYSLFWDSIPFIILLYVLEAHRGRHVGSRLVHHFEQKMRGLRFKRALVSSRSEGRSQHFWRKLGYRDIGGFALPKEPYELLFLKEL